MTLTRKLSLLFVLLSLVPVVVVGIFAFNNGQQTIEENTRDRLASTTLLKEAEFNRWVDSSRSNLRTIAKRPLLTSLLETLVQPDPSDLAYSISYDYIYSDHLIPLVEEERGFTILFILHPDTGQILVSSDETQVGKYRESEPYFIEGRRGTFVQNVYYSLPLQRSIITIATPFINRDGESVAVLAGHLDLDEASRIMAQETELNATEETYLVNAFNFFVTTPQLASEEDLPNAVHTMGVNHCLAHNNDINTYIDYRGRKVIGAYRWIAERELCILTEVDEAEALAPIVDFRSNVMLFGAVVALVSGGLGAGFSRTLTRPVRQLLNGVREVGRGNLDYQVAITASDEIGQLSRAFDEMVNDLRQITASRDELDREIAERRRAEEQLRQLNQKLEVSNTNLQQFAYVASHDLQEPLRMVSSYLQLLRRRYAGQLDQDADDFIDYAVGGANRMKTLIRDLLQFSRIDSQSVPFEETDVRQVLQDVQRDMKLMIEESGAVIQYDEKLPKVHADKGQLEQLFQNLIANAIKFKADGAPLVQIRVQQLDEHWQFSVQDNGIGIAPEYKERIFAIFQRLHTIDKYPGTGIGLAMCKRIVERHSGEIWVESAEGEGSTFFFTLPIKQGKGIHNEIN